MFHVNPYLTGGGFLMRWGYLKTAFTRPSANQLSKIFQPYFQESRHYCLPTLLYPCFPTNLPPTEPEHAIKDTPIFLHSLMGVL